jgi:hypothetical protein
MDNKRVARELIKLAKSIISGHDHTVDALKAYGQKEYAADFAKLFKILERSGLKFATTGVLEYHGNLDFEILVNSKDEVNMVIQEIQSMRNIRKVFDGYRGNVVKFRIYKDLLK